ncbi:unnamed protein product [Staurois parvus]|uniref:BPTI/Kunitz inhibitor domain-containing protein n=1 Tax=Staurois parvus TaxID=386267 RepID=A0ABN9HIV3_9NEOB|nr:unnamed protein product [Staurois parvus]
MIWRQALAIFICGGCEGNANNFHTKEACEIREICDLPKDPGPCEAFMPHFYYDKNTGTCELFIYGGCKGNANNFRTKEACENACQSQPGICYLPKEVGPCEALMPRFYYDKNTGTCELFIYGGCKGNANNFSTKEACENACQSQPGICCVCYLCVAQR